MSGRVGSITTAIIADGLVFNMDAANRASTIPSTSTTKTLNTLNLSQSGSIITDATWQAGSNPTFDFDGSDGYINTNFTIDNSYSELTLSAWVNYTNFNGSYPAVMGQWVNSNFLDSTWLMYVWPTGKINTIFTSGDHYVQAGYNTALSTGVWYNITTTWDGSIVKQYINATQDGSTPSLASLNNGASTMLIGAWLNNAQSGIQLALNGEIGPIQVYDRGLSANEVLHNYNALKGRFA